MAADLHLGKTTSFQRAGIPIPAGATTQTIDLMMEHVASLRPKRLVILGDLVHGSCSWDDEVFEGLSRLAHAVAPGAFHLVEGNHDRRSRGKWETFALQVHSPPFPLDPWILLHDESTERPLASSAAAGFIAGHLHPSIRMGRKGESYRLKCFRLYNQCLTLPAFGRFTGSKTILAQPDQQIFAIVEDSVIPIKA